MNWTKLMLMMSCLFISHTVNAAMIYIENFTKDPVKLKMECRVVELNKTIDFECGHAMVNAHEIIKYEVERPCQNCAVRVVALSEDGKSKFCDTGDAVHYKLMLVSVRPKGNAASCAKSVDPEDSQKLFP